MSLTYILMRWLTNIWKNHMRIKYICSVNVILGKYKTDFLFIWIILHLHLATYLECHCWLGIFSLSLGIPGSRWPLPPEEKEKNLSFIRFIIHLLMIFQNLSSSKNKVATSYFTEIYLWKDIIMESLAHAITIIFVQILYCTMQAATQVFSSAVMMLCKFTII